MQALRDRNQTRFESREALPEHDIGCFPIFEAGGVGEVLERLEEFGLTVANCCGQPLFERGEIAFRGCRIRIKIFCTFLGYWPWKSGFVDVRKTYW